MTFLYPTVLFALAALTIPIVIHLFNFRRAKVIYFSNTEFLKDVKEVTSSKRRLKHYLILFTRLLFLLFLIFAFAQPYLPASKQGSSDRVNIYVDNSFSMLNQVVEGQTQQDIAIATADEIIKLYPEETRFKLINNAFESSADLYYGKTELEDRITEITQTPINRDLESLLKRIDYRSDPNQPALNFLISDFQKSTIGDLEMITLDSQQVYYLLPVQGSNSANIFIDSVYLASPFIREGEPNQIILTIRNTGPQDQNDLLLKLYINGSQASSTGVKILANSSTEAAFDLNFSLSNINKCRISFEDFPASFDNDFYFTLNLTNQIKVLEIKENAETSVIENVYGNPTLFNFDSYQAGNLDYSAIEQADLIVLNDLATIDPVLLPYLTRFLETKGTLLVIPSEAPDLKGYQSLIPQISDVKSTQESKTGLRSLDRDNPFFNNIFEENTKRFNMPEAISKIQWQRSGTDLLKFKQGEPFLSRFNFKGAIYLLSSPMKDAFTNFHKHALFVPVMYRIAVQSKSQSDFLYHNAEQEVITLKLDSLARNDIFRLKKQEEVLIPEQRMIGDELIFEIPQHSLNPGFYELLKEDLLMGIISINAHNKESFLENYSIVELESFFEERPNVIIRPVENINSLSKSIKEEQFGMSLWKYCLFLALLFLLVEILLIKFL